jgi:hypothetical protein
MAARTPRSRRQSPPPTPTLTIDLDAQHPRCGITDATHATQRECARVTLSAAKRRSPSALAMTCSAPPSPADASVEGELRWTAATPRETQTHASRTIAVERGAEAIAILATLEAPNVVRDLIAKALSDSTFASTGLTLIGRALDGSGADWLFDCSPDADKVLRLEVSGTESTSRRVIASRLREKCTQLLNAPSSDPGLAIVVAFATDPVGIHAELVVPES